MTQQRKRQWWLIDGTNNEIDENDVRWKWLIIPNKQRLWKMLWYDFYAFVFRSRKENYFKQIPNHKE